MLGKSHASLARCWRTLAHCSAAPAEHPVDQITSNFSACKIQQQVTAPP